MTVMNGLQAWIEIGDCDLQLVRHSPKQVLKQMALVHGHQVDEEVSRQLL
jgi:hypothetical protein